MGRWTRSPTRAGRYLGIAVANVVTMLSPSLVVIGGGVGSAGDLLLGPLRTELQERVRVAANAASFLAAGATAVGMGRDIFDPTAIDRGDAAAIAGAVTRLLSDIRRLS